MKSLKQAVAKAAEIAGSVERLPELAYRYLIGQVPPQSLLAGTARQSELEACLRYAEAGPLDRETMCAIRDVPMPDACWLNPGNWPQDI